MSVHVERDVTYLVEQESLGTYPGVPGVVLAVVEHLAVQTLVCIVACLLRGAVELGLRQQQCQPIWLLVLLFKLLLLQQVTFPHQNCVPLPVSPARTSCVAHSLSLFVYEI
jgi:hypothetical protein